MAKESARPLEELDIPTRENLVRILGIDPVAMNVHDQAFMRGRAAYLTAEQRKDYVDNVEPIVVETTDDEDSYEDWKVADLKAECLARGLEVGGKKADLAARLEDDDNNQ